MNTYLQGNLDIIESEKQKLILDTGKDYEFYYTNLEGMYTYYGNGTTVITGLTTYGVIKLQVPHD